MAKLKLIKMKIVIFFHLNFFPDKCAFSEIDTYIADVLKQAHNRKVEGGRKEETHTKYL